MISVLFVCLGNICRSPALEACLEKLIKDSEISGKVYVDSCGLSASFLGSDADSRMISEAEKNGVIISHKSQMFRDAFFEQFEFIFAVSDDQVEFLEEDVPKNAKAKVLLATAFSKKFKDMPIPDPYAEGGFSECYAIIQDAAKGIFEMLLKKYK